MLKCNREICVITKSNTCCKTCDIAEHCLDTGKICKEILKEDRGNNCQDRIDQQPSL